MLCSTIPNLNLKRKKYFKFEYSENPTQLYKCYKMYNILLF